MAIQLQITKGLDVYPQAYARISNFESNNQGNKTSIAYWVNIWKSAAHKEAGEPTIDRDRFEVTITDLETIDTTGLSLPFIAQLYLHLHAQAKYSGGGIV